MDKIQFDKFNGNDFNVWKFQIEAYFDFHGLLNIVNGTQRKPLDKKSKRMVLVGYESGSRAYRLWQPGSRRITASRDVKFIEPESKRIATLFPTTEKTELILPVEEDKKCSQSVGNNENNEFVNELVSLPVSSRTRSKTGGEANLAILLCAEVAPQSYKEAINSSNANDWRIAVDSEMASIIKNDTWILVELPANRKAIRNKWVYRVKIRSDGNIERYKARLVIKGC